MKLSVSKFCSAPRLWNFPSYGHRSGGAVTLVGLETWSWWTFWKRGWLEHNPPDLPKFLANLSLTRTRNRQQRCVSTKSLLGLVMPEWVAGWWVGSQSTLAPTATNATNAKKVLIARKKGVHITQHFFAKSTPAECLWIWCKSLSVPSSRLESISSQILWTFCKVHFPLPQ